MTVHHHARPANARQAHRDARFAQNAQSTPEKIAAAKAKAELGQKQLADRIALIKANEASITVFDFPVRTELTEAMMEDLALGLQTNTHLKILFLNNCKLTDKLVAILAPALIVNKTLESLTLVDNRITDEGAKTLAAALEQNSGLQLFSLRQNQLGNEGAKALAKVLSVHKGLKHLHLANNKIQVEGAKALAETLEASNLESVSIDENDLREEEANAIFLPVLIKSVKIKNFFFAAKKTLKREDASFSMTSIATQMNNLIDVIKGKGSEGHALTKELRQDLAKIYESLKELLITSMKEGLLTREAIAGVKTPESGIFSALHLLTDCAVTGKLQEEDLAQFQKAEPVFQRTTALMTVFRKIQEGAARLTQAFTFDKACAQVPRVQDKSELTTAVRGNLVKAIEALKLEAFEAYQAKQEEIKNAKLKRDDEKKAHKDALEKLKAQAEATLLLAQAAAENYLQDPEGLAAFEAAMLPYKDSLLSSKGVVQEAKIVNLAYRFDRAIETYYDAKAQPERLLLEERLEILKQKALDDFKVAKLPEAAVSKLPQAIAALIADIVAEKITVERIQTFEKAQQEKAFKTASWRRAQAQVIELLRRPCFLKGLSDKAKVENAFDRALALVDGDENDAAANPKLKSKDELRSAFQALKTKAMQDLAQGRLKREKAKELSQETEILAEKVSNETATLQDVKRFQVKTAPFIASWNWKMILGAVVAAAVGFVLGAMLGALAGPAGAFAAIAAGYALAICVASMVSLVGAAAVLIVSEHTILEKRKHNLPVTKTAAAAAEASKFFPTPKPATAKPEAAKEAEKPKMTPTPGIPGGASAV